MYGFLRSPKWLLGHVLVATVVVTFTAAGFWQLDRLDQARERNAAIAESMAAEPAPVDEALGSQRPDYRRVHATGEFDAEHQLLSAPRSVDGQPAQHVLTPLHRADGETVLVDRGWIPYGREEVADEEIAPPSGEVTVTGLLLPPEEGDPGEGEATTTIAPGVAEERLGLDLASRHLQLQTQDPSEQALPTHADPTLDEGNHFSYAVQWFIFTIVVLVGYPILIWRTGRDRGAEAGGDGEGAPQPGEEPGPGATPEPPVPSRNVPS
ncbi:SURF1 family protein [Egibacter rhizosphaerae]|uniref:SURF1 family cytochrome oxidase biogenesis protein n=1 Tax=Egibacter rhizosphaerae TaxID=1670831 RepID=UPI0013F15290|nr:SURF1 family protein [Egibacter rhizosphaerae]